MLNIHKYLFVRLYAFYIKVLKEKQIPHYFAIGVISIIIEFNIIVIIDSIFYAIAPHMIHVYSKYFSYGALLLLVVYLFRYAFTDKYKTVIKWDSGLTKEKKRLYAVLSLIYVALTVWLFFLMGDIVREYHLSNPEILRN